MASGVGEKLTGNVIRTHAISTIGQLAAALPPVVVLIVLTRTSGLEMAGLFTVALGISAMAFTVALWGFRTVVLTDRLMTISASTLVTARLIALSVAGIVVLVLSHPLNLGVGLIVGLILYKACDGLLDLELALTQLREDTDAAVGIFAKGHLAKLALLIVGLAVVVGFGLGGVEVGYIVSGLIVLAVSLHQLLVRHAYAKSGVSSISIYRAFAMSAWFALAASVCALVTSAPRFSLAWLYDGDRIGIVGVSLSVGALSGMVFATTWLRYLPQFADEAKSLKTALRFLFELIAIAVPLLLASWYVIPFVVAWLFKLGGTDWYELTRLVLTSTVLFFAGMGTCNLYKVTRHPWMESVCYGLALLSAVAAFQASNGNLEITTLLLVAGGVMLAGGTSALMFLRPRDQLGEPGDGRGG